MLASSTFGSSPMKSSLSLLSLYLHKYVLELERWHLERCFATSPRGARHELAATRSAQTHIYNAFEQGLLRTFRSGSCLSPEEFRGFVAVAR